MLGEAQAEAFGLKEQLRRLTLQMGVRQSPKNTIAAQLAKRAERPSRAAPQPAEPIASSIPMHAGHPDHDPDHDPDAGAGAEGSPSHGQGGASPDLGLLDEDALAESPPELREALLDDNPQLRRHAQPLFGQPFV